MVGANNRLENLRYSNDQKKIISLERFIYSLGSKTYRL